MRAVQVGRHTADSRATVDDTARSLASRSSLGRESHGGVRARQQRPALLGIST